MSAANHVIAIQARTGSTRLQGKMTREFFNGKTILELIIEQLLTRFSKQTIVVATSELESDNVLQNCAEQAGVRCSRGSEKDVLGRVVEAVSDDDVDCVVRICADNPFLRAESVADLIVEFQKEPCDYASFALSDGTPTILSHLGLFAEAVSKQTLMSIDSVATSPRHREHLTSHILDFPDRYDRRFLPVPELVSRLNYLRLTVDTPADFEVCQHLYEAMFKKYGGDFSTEQLVAGIQSKPELHQMMAQEIAANEKR